jgi:hypothetical protein
MWRIVYTFVLGIWIIYLLHTKTVVTARTVDGHRQNTKTSTAVQTGRKKEHRATEEEMEGPTSSAGLRNRLTRLNLHEHDDE